MTPADCVAVAPFGIVHDLTSAGPPVKKVCNSKSSKLVRTILFNPDSSRLYSDKNIFSSSGDNKEISCSIEAHTFIRLLPLELA